MENKSVNSCPATWILLRGLTRGSMHWLGFDELFRKKFLGVKVICPDLAGNGLLFDQETPQKMDDAVNQIRDQVNLPGKKIGLFSVSMGGMIGTRWAEMYPDEVTHLVVVNSSFASQSRFYDRLLPSSYFGLIKSIFIKDPEQIENFIMKITSNFEEKWKPYLPQLVEYQKKYPVSSKNFMRQLDLSGQTHFMTRPNAQTLVLNSNGDHLVSPKCSFAIARLWNSKFETHPTAGHDLPLDAPEWTLDMIQKNFKI